MSVEPVSFRVDRLDLKDEEAKGAAKNFYSESDGLACGSWAFGLNTYCSDIGPRQITLPIYEVIPDYLDRRRDDCGRADCKAHLSLLRALAMVSWD